MADIRRTIGLSLGADLCWPICYEQVLDRLDLIVAHGGDSIRFDVERVTIEPFYLRQPVKYDLVVDRLTHWYGTSREWIKKAILMNDVYVFNNRKIGGPVTVGPGVPALHEWFCRTTCG